MHYWVFNEAMLDDALADRQGELQRNGASEQQVRDETAAIKEFLMRAAPLQGYVGDAGTGTQR